eukprot:185453_1
MAPFSLLIVLVYYIHITFSQVVVTQNSGTKKYELKINGKMVCPSTDSVTLMKANRDDRVSVDLSTILHPVARLTRLLTWRPQRDTVQCGTESVTQPVDLDELRRRIYEPAGAAQQHRELPARGGEGTSSISVPDMKQEFRDVRQAVRNPEGGGYETKQHELVYATQLRKHPQLFEFLNAMSAAKYLAFTLQAPEFAMAKGHLRGATPTQREAILADYQVVRAEHEKMMKEQRELEDRQMRDEMTAWQQAHAAHHRTRSDSTPPLPPAGEGVTAHDAYDNMMELERETIRVENELHYDEDLLDDYRKDVALKSAIARLKADERALRAKMKRQRRGARAYAYDD